MELNTDWLYSKKCESLPADLKTGRSDVGTIDTKYKTNDSHLESDTSIQRGI